MISFVQSERYDRVIVIPGVDGWFTVWVIQEGLCVLPIGFQTENGICQRKCSFCRDVAHELSDTQI